MESGIAEDGSKISPRTLEITSWIFYGVAMLAAVFRATLRIRQQQMFKIDDFLLILACACLTAGTVILPFALPSVYALQRMALNPDLPVVPEDVLSQFRKLDFSYMSLTWMAIFAIKLSFLFFFRPLLDRLPRLIRYWRITLAVTVFEFFFCATDNVYMCANPAGSPDMQCQHRGFDILPLALGAVAIFMDIATDIMIVSIPIYLIWKVQLGIRRKLGMACFLCLQIAMAIVSITKMSGINVDTTLDTPWLIYWQQIETCIAVIMCSLTAFRSVFISDDSKNNTRPPRVSYSSTAGKLQSRRSQGQQKDQVHGLPSIPSVTVTGKRSRIQGVKRNCTTESVNNDSTEDAPLHVHSHQIMVTNAIDVDVEKLGGVVCQDEKDKPVVNIGVLDF